MNTAVSSLPLFPLRSVLFPGGELGLRVFEPRYLRMVRDCARNQTPFAIALLRDGDLVRLGQVEFHYKLKHTPWEEKA